MQYSEDFGFLEYPKLLEFEGGKIVPFADFTERYAALKKCINKDGFYYPPQIKEVRLDPKTLEPKSTLPHSQKPASVFRLPPSHKLYINDLSAENDRTDAALIIYLLGFFFRTRLQFCDLRFDGKVPLKGIKSFIYRDDVLSDFVSHTYRVWKLWSSDQRRRFINIVYMHCKARSCEWDWDAFIYRYMVFDAIYKFHTELGNPKINNHISRLVGLCEHYSIRFEMSVLTKIYKLRNELFHEALWDDSTPGYKGGEAYLNAIWLDKLTSRLIVCITGYKNEYSKSGWWAFGWEKFDKSK